MPSNPQTDFWLLLLRCGICGEGVVAKYQSGLFLHWVQSNGLMAAPDPVGIWPEAKQPEIPEHLPDKVHRLYLQGITSLRQKSYDAAGTMFRKCLDSALKHIHPDGRGTLKERIDKLPEALSITPAMKQWAHEIRILGNDAAHEDELFTKDEATILQSFTEIFLRYSLTLPEMLNQRRGSV